MSATPARPGTASARRPTLSPSSWAWLLLAVPVVVHGIGTLRFGSWLVDDGLISAAYARTLAQAGTFAQSPRDAPVEGVSDPLWTLLLALLRLLGLFDQGHVWCGRSDYVWVVRVLSLLCFAGIVACFHRTARTVAGPRAAALGSAVGGTLLALAPPWAIWSLSGLENPLFGLLAAGLLLTTARAGARGTLLRPATAVACGVLVVLAAGTRPDGIILGGAYPVLALLTGRRRVPLLLGACSLYGVVVAVPLGTLLLWRHATFGLWVPNTAIVKEQSFPTLAVLAQQPRALAAASAWPLALLAVGLLAAWLLVPRLRARAKWALLSNLALLSLAAAGFAVLDRDWMPEGRFTTAAVVLTCGLVTLATAVLLPWLRDVGRLPAATGTAALLLALLATVQVSIPRVHAFVANATISGCYAAERYGEVFNWYAAQFDIGDDGSLLTPDIGGTLMTSRLRVVDLAGLTEPAIGRYRGADDPAAIRDHVLTRVRPTFIHIHPPWSAGLELDPRFLADYQSLTRDHPRAAVLGPPEDFVRRDAVSGSADLVRIAEEGQALVDRVGPHPGTLDDCGPLTVGKLPE